MLSNQIFQGLYKNIPIDQINQMYKTSGYYVFRRKKHDGHKYRAYLNANKGSAENESLTMPAFPTYLLPPESILETMSKSPKLSFRDGFRESNWNDMIGKFFCKYSELSIPNQNNLTRNKILIKHLNSLKIKNDDYIYSIYYIENRGEGVFYCCHFEDITQKNSVAYGTLKV